MKILWGRGSSFVEKKFFLEAQFHWKLHTQPENVKQWENKAK